MSEDDQTRKRDAVRVRSDLAGPSRPGGYSGVRQPIGPATPVDPPDRPPEDTDLAKRIRHALEADGRISEEAIAVGVSNGVADLEGRVKLEFERSLAEAIARSVPGVLNVANRLEVDTT